MTKEEILEFGDAIVKGLDDYEGYYENADLDELLKTLERLFIYRERMIRLIDSVKLDILQNYIERPLKE